MSFKIGQKVVCVKGFDQFKKHYPEVTMPKVDDILTIRDVIDDDDALRFFEIVNPIQRYTKGTMEAYYADNHFRLIDYQFGEMVAESITKECEKETVKEVITLNQ